MKPFLFLICLLGTAGCMKLEMPAHMVSDTIDAGKDLYHGINNKSGKADNGKNIIFSYTHIGSKDLSTEELEQECLTKLEEEAKEKFNSNELAYTVLKSEIVPREKDVVICCRANIL